MDAAVKPKLVKSVDGPDDALQGFLQRAEEAAGFARDGSPYAPQR